jgi:hypothetical protein
MASGGEDEAFFQLECISGTSYAPRRSVPFLVVAKMTQK